MMSTSVEQHKADSSKSITCAVITVSDTRTIETDRGGKLVCELLSRAGHSIHQHAIVRDEPDEMASLLRTLDNSVQAVLMTGGTGIAARDQTYETISSLLTKTVPGYGELFRMLSYEEIGAAAMLSRAIGGLIGNVVVLTMPGSPAAVRLAMDKLIIPELAHLVHQASN